MKKAAFGVAVQALVLLLAAGTARADAPLRHLVYKFTYGSSSNIAVTTTGIHNSNPDTGTANESGSGIQNFSNSIGDQGTVTIDVVKEESDSGLLVIVSEQSQNNRSTAAAKCVVYGATVAVVCDPNGTVHEESFAILRLVGPNFIDPGRIDSKQHWSVQTQTGAASGTSDFTIATNNAGLMKIDETRAGVDRVQGRNARVVTTATIGYDFAKFVPTSLSEISMTREQQGADSYHTLRVEITAQLLTDSGAWAR